jgi:cold shock CspA family protein
LIGDYKSSLKYALDAALGSGELKFKWELFYLIYETLEKLGNHEYSIISLKLAAAIRINEKWKLREKLTQSLAKHNIALDNLNVNTLKNKLDELAYSQLNKGIIKDYNAEKRIGFIEFNDSRIYFRASSYKGNASQLKIGERVIFAEDTDYDPVKKKESLAAYFVKRIN